MNEIEKAQQDLNIYGNCVYSVSATGIKHIPMRSIYKEEPMGTREAKVEKYLDTCVKKLGGMTRKWTGYPGVPDRIVFINNKVWFVEVKTVDGKLSDIQKREHERLFMVGANVAIVYGKEGVDSWIERRSSDVN